MTLWTYYGPYDHKDEYDELRGNRYGYAVPSYLSRDGTLLPTVPWEAIREGINDWRYARTLRHWVEKARAAAGTMDASAAAGAELASLADEAAGFLGKTLDRIPWGTGAQKGTWKEVDADGFRQGAVERILALKGAGSQAR